MSTNNNYNGYNGYNGHNGNNYHNRNGENINDQNCRPVTIKLVINRNKNDDILEHFGEYQCNMSKSIDGNFVIINFVNIKKHDSEKMFNTIENIVKDMNIIFCNYKMWIIEWYPKILSDMDIYTQGTCEFSDQLDVDHPGFKDDQYLARRKEIVNIAKQYKGGEIIPKINYTEEENNTWKIVYQNIKKLYPKYACKQHQQCFEMLENEVGYSPNKIPQLQDISNFLKKKTGFSLRPVQGLLPSRDFLNGLAFGVFHATQYIRHHSNPMYTPEPDVCHELLGHVPLFADPDFAKFSREIGLASLGATDEDIKKLASVYWFTIEFGICKEGDKIKAFGAGLLSSFGELEYALSGKPTIKPFDPFIACEHPYIITHFQDTLFLADSFDSATNKINKFSKSLDRPFTTSFNYDKNCVETFDKIDL